ISQCRDRLRRSGIAPPGIIERRGRNARQVGELDGGKGHARIGERGIGEGAGSALDVAFHRELAGPFARAFLPDRQVVAGGWLGRLGQSGRGERDGERRSEHGADRPKVPRPETSRECHYPATPSNAGRRGLGSAQWPAFTPTSRRRGEALSLRRSVWLRTRAPAAWCSRSR